MDIEGATSLESLMDQMPWMFNSHLWLPPKRHVPKRSTQDLPAVVAQPEKKEEKKKYSTRKKFNDWHYMF